MANDGAAKKPKIDKALGERSKALPFDPKRRAAFLECIEKGASISQACKIEGISRETVQAWLRVGRSDGEACRPERRAFARAFDRASTEGIVKVLENLRKDTELAEGKGIKASLALLGALDPRFGDRALKKRALELSNQRAELENRMMLVRVNVAEAAASGKSETPAFGLAGLLADEDLALEVRQAVAAWSVRKGYVAVERLDWEAA